MKLYGERRIDDVELAAGVHHEVKRTDLVDFHRNDEERSGDETRMQAGDVPGAMRFCPAGDGCEGESGGEKDPERGMERWGFHVDLRSRVANRRRHWRLYLATSID